ncbi:MAG: hypothetical protein Q4E03_02375 [Trueperella sp.]|nr:hypothetical protein [Trueperella sp.]
MIANSGSERSDGSDAPLLAQHYGVCPEREIMQQKTKRRAALLMAIPLAVALSACEVHTTIKINDTNSGETVMVIKDTTGELSQYGMTCDALKESANEDSDVPVTVEDISADGVLTCKMTSPLEGDLTDGGVVTETEDTYIFTLPPSEDAPAALGSQGMPDGVVFTFTVEMPGDIVKADGADISGNRAVYNSLDKIEGGITVEGYKSAPGAGGAKAPETTDNNENSATNGGKIDQAAPDTAKDDETSPLVWVAVAVVALALIGGIVFFATRKKNKGDDAAVPPYTAFSENPPAGDNAAGSAWQPEKPGVFTPPTDGSAPTAAPQPPAEPNPNNDSGWTPKY